MKKIIAYIIISLAAIASPYASAQMQWRETSHSMAAQDMRKGEFEVSGKNGIITVRTSKTIQVRVFTILGQLVSQATLNPGTSELKINSRGIYIVKIDNYTQKVAL